ncbi:hypothetical protein ADZ36_18880 [Streptomyces fradiae]|uniref:Uncharacterized protein n=3 Tax=Streptomyces TaxID=1883 RepID=A0A3R7LIT8_9ACTN|nr:hypothetical protein ADZ36_18880 [Streptomyces fradiae]OFA49727.1 hypothetical protein BEN35_16640 [Streptomyces fradiae]PQM19891.1 hypothetical protein Sfr7A_30215 [Streptomyces xinghaiensis]RKM90909.1 hypothetical protein SFRA_030730 [Streptomyces xinghaiensis]RNC68856.1 hypothetical protein DC095_031310 [Streptomyces xinghaiensis]
MEMETAPETQPLPEAETAEPQPEPVPEPGPGPEREPGSAPEPAPRAAALTAAPAPRPERRVLRAVLRWTAATLVFAGLAGGVGYGLAQAERTELPGLATEHDGRWDFGTVERPALPAGVPGPYDEDNAAAAHHADPRDLLLPLPAGAKPDRTLPAEDGWLPVEDFLRQYDADYRQAVREELTDNSCRHIAARGWTMPDGTRTRIHLLQFNTEGLADTVHGNVFASAGLFAGADLVGAPQSALNSDWSSSIREGESSQYVYDESEPYGKRQVRHAYITAGDTIALVVQSSPGETPEVPFQQTVVLQTRLLG